MSNVFSAVGRLARSAELKAVGDSTVLKCNVATDVGYGANKKTLWIKAALWGKRGEALEQYLTKGTSVFLTGELSIQEYTKKDGSAGFSAEVRLNNIDLLSRPESREDSKEEPNLKVPEPSPKHGNEDLPF